jgi:hypothetical protein
VLLDLYFSNFFSRKAINDILFPELKFFMVAMQLHFFGDYGSSNNVSHVPSESFATPGLGLERFQ